MKTLNIFGTPSIRRRIASAFVIMTLFVLILVTASYFQLRQIRPFSDLIVQDSSDLVNIQTLSSATSALDADLERYLLIQGAEYKDSVQTDLQGMTDSLALLQKDPIAGTDTVLSDLGTTLTGLQEKITIILDSESTSSADTNRSIITIYNDIEDIKLLQEELSATTLTALQTTAQRQGLIADNVLTQSVILGIIVSLIAVITTVVTDRRLRTISTLTNTAAAITAGDLSRVAPVESNDEIGTLAGAFNNMTSQLRELIGSLEGRVAARTKDLATVAEVGTATATILETDKLLQAVVELTKERFNLYHSHIYLLDEKGENLVLTAGAGEPGRIMAAEKRFIPLSREQSLVARAARERKGVTVNDVTQAPDFLPNPLLPNTRSELAVPMLVGESLIGVFDIQSDQVGRFTESDINIQTTLAAQVSTSIQNVRSFEQSKAQADLESLVNTIGQKIQRATTVEDTLQTAIREVGLALGAARVSAHIQAGHDHITGEIKELKMTNSNNSPTKEMTMKKKISAGADISKQMIQSATLGAVFQVIFGLFSSVGGFLKGDIVSWQNYVLLVTPIVVFIFGLTGLLLLRRGKPLQGSSLVFINNLLLPIVAILLQTGLGWAVFVYALTSSIMLIWQAMPKVTRSWTFILTALSLALIVAMEWFSPSIRVAAGNELSTFFYGASAILVIVFLVQSVRQALGGSLRTKLLVPSISVVVVLALGLITYTTIFTIQRNQTEAERDLTRTAIAIESSIEELQTLALGLSTEMASNPQVQAAFAARDRQLLTKITLPTFEVVQKEFGVKQFQFILPPATSFLRLHQLEKYGDDLSSIRFTTLEANATQKPVSGIEIGRGGLGVRGEVPIFYQGQHLGVMDVGLDIGSTYLEDLKKQYGVDVQILLETEAAQAATFEGVTSEFSGPISNLLLQASTFKEALYADPTVYERALKGETVVSQLTSKDKTYSVISTPLKDYSGKVIGVLEISLDRTEIIASQYQSLLLTILLSLVATVLGSFILARFITYTLQPINTLTETAVALTNGDLERQVMVQSDDELGILANAFNNMTGRLRGLIGGLEARVAERTRNLELAAEVGRTVSQVRALDVMLKDAAELIRKQFDLYYVQVYLTDSSQNHLNLQAGTGQVGKQLLERSHSLPLNTYSINGRAAMEKKPVVISDTNASAAFKPNPLLPNTRSEMAVPLVVGEKVVGVLDMQSEHAESLNKDILPAFEALAGQLAIAIQNATLLAEAQQARAEVEAQARRQSRSNWAEYLDGIHKPERTGFVFEQNKVAPLAQENQAKENAITASISVAGEMVGNLSVEMEGQAPIARTDELIDTVARQVAQHIENLRLLESADRFRYEAEQATRRLTHEGWQEYMDVDAAKGAGYIYDLNEVRPYERDEIAQAEEAGISLPIKARDEAIGKLVLKGVDANDSEALDIASAVAERLGAHIEGLRLSMQTEQALAASKKQAQREQALRQITSAVRGSTDPATILRTAARELGNILGRQTVVHLATAGSKDPAEIKENEPVPPVEPSNADGGK